MVNLFRRLGYPDRYPPAGSSMGLDGVEIVLQVEEAFDIELPDSVSERMYTVGELFDFINETCRLQNSDDRCLTSSTFYLLRRAFRDLGVSERIHPATDMNSVLPPTQRKEFWARLRRTTNLNLPDLCRPDWLVSLCAVITLITSAAIGYQIYQTTNSVFWALVIDVVTLIALAFGVAWLTRPFATRTSRSWAHFRGFTESVLSKNLKTLTERFNTRNSRDVWIVLRSIIVDQLGVDSHKVTPDAHFVNDLGLS